MLVVWLFDGLAFGYLVWLRVVDWLFWCRVFERVLLSGFLLEVGVRGVDGGDVDVGVFVDDFFAGGLHCCVGVLCCCVLFVDDDVVVLCV